MGATVLRAATRPDNEQNPDAVEQKPDIVEQNPDIVEQNPYDVEQNPYDVEQNPYGVEQNPYAIELNPYGVELNPYDVELNPDIDKPNLVDIGRLQCRRHPPEATKNFFAGVCTFGGLKRLIDHGYARTQPHRPGKEREKVAARRGAFLWIGTESPGAVDSSVPAHESRNRFHAGADRALPLSAQ
jgi:hypothetical protein